MSTSSDSKAIQNIAKDIQKALEGNSLIESCEAMALTMISMGCKLNNISGNITPEVIQHINDRYHTLGQANIADALILQGYIMMSWGEGHSVQQQPEDKEGDDSIGKQ